MNKKTDTNKDPRMRVAGAAFGGVMDGVAENSAARSIDAAQEDKYWKEQFKDAPHVDHTLEYVDYEPAYRFGWESYHRYEGRQFADLNVELQRDWDAHRADSPLTWEKARAATEAAWRRVEHRYIESTASGGPPHSVHV
ncbi:MAG: hypothetical protein ABIR28_13035 [Vicinamibacteria bacterium]